MDLDAAVTAAQSGDEAAFRVVYRAVQPQLLQYVRSLVGPGDAEDVASESWLQIARDLPEFRGGGAAVRGWAARIARNRALDHIRARSRRPVSGAGVDELVQLPDRADTAGEALDAVATDAALAAIAALPREQAEAVLLRVVMGLDSTSAARVLGRRPGSVRMATHRGLRRLAEQLAEAGGASGAAKGSDPADPGGPSGLGGLGGAAVPRARQPGGLRGAGPGPGGPETAENARTAGNAGDTGGGGGKGGAVTRGDVTFSASKAL
ncbi:RNA polymerase sigma factor [Actinacidiphila guanduensis]|uniref:RNA polymerase sigma factor n=1 Tax=Actinacidiphila guanduensis TaxID=310781 RepID=UPI002AFE0122|nr:RNA polymerase sigma factor [Actinacidiphila guanduensis]